MARDRERHPHAMLRTSVVAAAVATVLLVTGCTSAGRTGAAATSAPIEKSPRSLTIAIAGMVTPAEGLAYYTGLAEYLGRKVGVPVRLIHKADYAQVNDMLEQKKVDVAFVCSGPYVQGHDKFGLELLGAPVVNGQPRYYAYLIVPASSDATSMASLRGKVFAVTDPQSNSGYNVPTGMVAALGSTPKEFFSRFYFTYSHDVSIKDVATGQADGASVDSLIFDYAAATDPKYTSKVKVVGRSEPYGVPPVVVRPGVPVTLKQQLRVALLGASEDPEGQALLAKMHVDRFIVVPDSAYDSVRALAKGNSQASK